MVGVLVPYIRAKLDRLYEEESIRQRARQALADDARDASWRAFYARAFVRAYPWCVAAHEGSRFAYQLLYLLGKTPYYLPGLHLLGLRVARTDPAAARAHAKAQAARRARRAAGGDALPAPLRLLCAATLRAGYLVADNARSALVLSVFAFKLLEWWYSAGERALGERKALEPPPPPPPLAPAPDGLALPEDTSLCPICSSKRVNPTLVATSGYAYCYVCIHKHVTERGCCPVTLEPAKLSDLWRLYPGM
ncbi:hypothetical protein QBZ16_004700 [Prototheca wickerhamii]|uniref:Peroxin-12 n=1 Tax=Prototheca wickerhamii TaxID=3111 RepID=A0AAD9IJ70_PROWI|nr:hypothetical protein QBZ16_004700 [Prototheca wickerhamii]